MKKIRLSPIEKVKTAVIAVLTVTMLALAAFYIGGSQFYTGGAAINSGEMPSGAVAAGENAPNLKSVYEQGLLRASFAGIRFDEHGGGSYSTEPAANNLLDFSLDGIHTLLSYSAKISQSSKEDFEAATDGGRFICISLISPLPYQIIYALSGEYVAPASYENAISADTLMIVFDRNCNASLYMRDGEKYYVSFGEYTYDDAELAVMASDSRLYGFEIANGIPISETSPLAQTISVKSPELCSYDELALLLDALEYTGNETVTLATTESYSIVAPHGVLSASSDRILYTAENEGGIPISSFHGSSKSELDIDINDILLASVSLAQKICKTFEQSTYNMYLDGFYHGDDTYTIVFGATEDGIPLSGEKYPHLVRLTVSGGRFKSIDTRLILIEKSGLPFSPFSSAWEYRHAAKSASVSSIGLRYNIDEIPLTEQNAAWYYTGERQGAR